MSRHLWAALSASLLVTTPAAAQETQRYTLSGERVAVYNIAGDIRVQGGTGSAVTVEVRALGPDAASLRVETGTIDGRETLRVIYPDDRIVFGVNGREFRTRMHVRADGTWGGGGRGEREITIRGSGDGLEAHANVVVTVPQGREVGVYLGAGEVSARDVNSQLDVDVAAASVTIERQTGDLSVDAGSGAVDVRDVTGAVNLDTGSGSVTVRGVRGPSLWLDTGSGSVTCESITADDVNIDTGSGRVDVRGVSASSVRLDTGSGGVRLELTSDVRDVTIDTGSGGVTLAIPADLGAQIEVETGSGGISLDVPVQATTMKRDYLRGTIGDGRGDIRIDTGSGGVRIVRAG